MKDIDNQFHTTHAILTILSIMVVGILLIVYMNQCKNEIIKEIKTISTQIKY